MESMEGKLSHFYKIFRQIFSFGKQVESSNSGRKLLPLSPAENQAYDVEETEYEYHEPRTAELLEETARQMKEVAALKEQLSEELLKLSDELTQEKVMCESLESEIKKAQDEVHVGNVCHQTYQFRTSLTRVSTLVGNVDTFHKTELLNAIQEVMCLKAAQDKGLEVIDNDIACSLKVIQERQTKESHLRGELWVSEDEGEVSELKSAKMEAITSYQVKKNEEGEKAHDAYIGYVQKVMGHVDQTCAETSEVCCLFSNVLQIPHHSENGSGQDATLLA